MPATALVTREVLVENELGIHLRAASEIVKVTARFKSRIHIVNDGLRVNAQSIMNIAMLVAGPGTILTIEARGKDAEAAAEALAQVFRDKFGEK